MQCEFCPRDCCHAVTRIDLVARVKGACPRCAGPGCCAARRAAVEERAQRLAPFGRSSLTRARRHPARSLARRVSPDCGAGRLAGALANAAIKAAPSSWDRPAESGRRCRQSHDSGLFPCPGIAGLVSFTLRVNEARLTNWPAFHSRRYARSLHASQIVTLDTRHARCRAADCAEVQDRVRNASAMPTAGRGPPGRTPEMRPIL